LNGIKNLQQTIFQIPPFLPKAGVSELLRKKMAKLDAYVSAVIVPMEDLEVLEQIEEM
jgi:hypothetical protein